MDMFNANREISKLPIPLKMIMIKCRDNMLCAATGNFELDIIKFDKQLSINDSEYDSENCTYRGNDISIIDYIELKYGKEVCSIINKIIGL